MRELLIATRNKGKLPEIVAKLQGLQYEFLTLNDVPDLPTDFVVEEPAMTFEGNAILKAIIYGDKTGLLTLADDSGLEVDALGGRPGVRSARYVEGNDADRYKKLLDELKDIPDARRGAQYHAVVAVYDPIQTKIRTCEGIYRGRITHEPRGTNNFGHDPIFYDEKLRKTCAEMTMEEKNSVSHRGMALDAARKILTDDFLDVDSGG